MQSIVILISLFFFLAKNQSCATLNNLKILRKTFFQNCHYTRKQVKLLSNFLRLIEEPFESKSALETAGTRLIMSVKLTLVLAYPTFYCLLQAVARGCA